MALRADGDVLAPLPDGRRRWVHHGSSISHCIEADGPTGTWPVVAAALGGMEVINLSQAGNALLDPYVARTIRDTSADLISLKVGINIVSLSPSGCGPSVPRYTGSWTRSGMGKRFAAHAFATDGPFR